MELIELIGWVLGILGVGGAGVATVRLRRVLTALRESWQALEAWRRFAAEARAVGVDGPLADELDAALKETDQAAAAWRKAIGGTAAAPEDIQVPSLRDLKRWRP